MRFEERVIRILRVAEPSIPAGCRPFLKRLAVGLLGWLRVPFELLRYADSQLRGRVQSRRDRDLTVVIVDPNLGAEALGHEMAFSLTVATYLIEQGIDVEVFGHCRLTPAVAAAFAARGIPCHKVFRHMRLGMVPVGAGDHGIGMLGRFLGQAFAFAADLTWGLARSGAGFPRLLFFPTSGLACIAGSSRLRRRRSRGDGAESQLHVLHAPAQLGGRGAYGSWFRQRLRGSSGVHLGTVNPQLNTELAALGEAAAIAIPIPRPVGLRPEPASAAAPRRMGFLGNASAGKGFTRLPALIPRLLASPGSFQIVVQTKPHLESPALDDAAETLRRIARRSNRIELVEEALAMDAYYELLRGLDVVVLPYDAEVYADKISSVAIEAMALGKVVVGPDVRWFADQQRVYGGYLAVDTADPEQLAARVLEAVERFDTLTNNAMRDAVKFDWHNVRSLATLLIELAERDGVSSAASRQPAVT